MKTIFILRKPPEGRGMAENTLNHGCGGLNIDATRISGVTWGRAGGEDFSVFEGVGRCLRPVARKSHEGGLYPANLLLSHLAGCGDKCVEGCPIKEQGEKSKFFKHLRRGK